jgi:toprim domain protein
VCSRTPERGPSVLSAVVIIVEGKKDREKLRRLIASHEWLTEDFSFPRISILCTNGIPSHERLMELLAEAGDAQVVVFTDGDFMGRRIRKLLRDVFPDAIHLHTKPGYAGVEGTPDEYLLRQLEKAGLYAARQPLE